MTKLRLRNGSHIWVNPLMVESVVRYELGEKLEEEFTEIYMNSDGSNPLVVCGDPEHIVFLLGRSDA